MNVNISEQATHITIITLRERVDTFTAPALRKQIYNLLDNGITKLVIDLMYVSFLDSAALAVLVSALKRARQTNGDVKLVWPRDKGAQRIFHLTKFDRVFDMAETAETAWQAFGGH